MADSNENPDGVDSIKWDDLGFLGVHESTGQLYWKGKEVVTRRTVSLRNYELFLATLASASAFGLLVLEIYKTFFIGP